MLRAGRPIDPVFDGSELLYYRFEGDFKLGSHLRGLEVRSPDFSVNREKHSGLPVFVLIPDWLSHGIAVFAVAMIPGPITSDGGTHFSWMIDHVPEERNYHHSEIYTLKEQVRCRKSSQISDLVKKAFRQALAERMKVIKEYEGDRL